MWNSLGEKKKRASQNSSFQTMAGFFVLFCFSCFIFPIPVLYFGLPLQATPTFQKNTIFFSFLQILLRIIQQ